MVEHEFPPVYDEHSKILILGSFPSPKSRLQGFYYGHPQNRFWKVISAVLGEALPTTIEEKKSLLARHHIALWDVIASCDIKGAGDSTIKNATPNNFKLITDAAPIACVFTTGKTAYNLYKRFTGKESVCLPSPSPANCAVSESALIAEYKTILKYLD